MDGMRRISNRDFVNRDFVNRDFVVTANRRPYGGGHTYMLTATAQSTTTQSTTTQIASTEE